MIDKRMTNKLHLPEVDFRPSEIVYVANLFLSQASPTFIAFLK